MKVPFLNLYQLNKVHSEEIKNAISGVIDSGRYILGDEVQKFQREFSDYCSCQYTLGVGNGYDALFLVLRAWLIQGRINKGDEVLVQSNTFIATIAAIVQNGLIPKLIEVDPETFNISRNKLNDVDICSAKVIIPVHLYGQAAPMDEILSFSEKFGMLVLEDCAQAHGAKYRGKVVGTLGDAGAYSFYPGKNLGALGDAGAVVSNDGKLIKIIGSIRNYGNSGKYTYAHEGVNSRLDELQAAILNVKIKYLDDEIFSRREIASKYLKEIKNELIILPRYPIEDSNSHVWHLFVIKCNHRDKLKEYLDNKGIETLIHYPSAVNEHMPYDGVCFLSGHKDKGEHNNILSIPIYSTLSEMQQDYIVSMLNEFEI